MKVHSYNYDSTYDGPAMPVVEVTIANVDVAGTTITLRAMIDSGADASMMSLDTLQRVGAYQVDRKRLRPVRGPSFVVDIYEVRMAIGPLVVPRVEVVADRQGAEAILGRDVLNHFIVTLNGLAGVVEISP